MQLETPYYLIDERRMQDALQKILFVQEQSGVRCVLALKCFSSFCAFDFMSRYFAGTTSSSLYEARLGHETFPGETHGYSVAWNEAEVTEVVRYCDKLIFNSFSQLRRFEHLTGTTSVGLRLNPEIGHSKYDLSNPVSQYSRLGVRSSELSVDVAEHIDGAMVHVNCENDDISSFRRQLALIEDRFARLLPKLSWLSLGGGLAFTDDGYPLDQFVETLATFSARHEVQLYLEPGEAAVTNSTSLIVQVLDIVSNEVPSLIVDAGVETHLLDVMTYAFTPELEDATPLPRDARDLAARTESNVARVCGRTCLAGDVFGNYSFARPVAVGDTLRFTNVAGYSIVKKNFFNGIKMPAIWHRRIDGSLQCVQQPSYEDFRRGLS